MKEFILALDQGTTSSRAIIFDKDGRPVATAQKEFRQFFPKPGWVEHDPDEIWSTQAGVALEAITKARLSGKNIKAIGITNQRETTVVWNRKTGNPVYKAIVWQDRRTADFCDKLKKEGYDKKILKKTGLIIDAYFSATKVKWILDNVKGAQKLAEDGKLAFGTIDSWLVWKLTGGRLHITDVSNASRTMLYNIHTLEWDSELLKIFNIPSAILPEVRSSSEVYGTTSGLFETEIPVAGIAGDQQAALFGQMCIEPGMVKNTYGTGCFMMMNTGSKPVESKNRLLTTIAWKIDTETIYALEGSIFIGGAVVQWLRDGLGIIKRSADVEKLAANVEDSGGVYFVPAFAGLGAPYWNQHARGTIVGLTRGTAAAHIARAALDSIAYQTLEVLLAMQKDSGLKIPELRVDGGATVNDRLMQFQSDILQAKVVRPEITQTTALGAAYLAGLAVKYWGSINEIKKQWAIDKAFTPSVKAKDTKVLIDGWHRAVKAAQAWAGEGR
ncbi:MAG: glycerol kinase [Bacteroidetes bacterium GWE2_41_25]|nr:MAG: glycerol kinase [Bacteroidetes bacterium GWA2_40_15]OFX93338.1 MAG: glycerol kinase [Bacteroidetes bacterium GWE2_41_25]OFX97793.1 MAG: glycerol kinase [Bacteroidetes bacterium GWC2_40_22]OFY60799.1 MAG: glycerol kinase [Bacteroidetes bacterium GWF2_41_9]HAM10261.1 glycerol kinase [Bacteroidales bacterium]